LQCLASRCVIRHLISTPEFIAMKVSPSGQPLITSMERHVSITHSGHYAGAMISSHQTVGLDLEEVSDKVMHIRHKFVNEEENKFLQSNDVMSTLVAWSAKESIFKWYGKGEVDFRKNITLHPFELKSRGLIQAAFTKPDCTKLLNVEYEVSGALVMTWLHA
jgi:4'-phosphopantetheinyl transferase